MSDCRCGVSPVNYPDPDPDPGVLLDSPSEIILFIRMKSYGPVFI